MDCTGSMSSYIAMCKDQVQNIVNLLLENYPSLKINISFVGYHDHGDKPLFEVLPFTTNPEVVKNFIANNVSARGGADIPEDICGGLRAALDLSWTSSNTLIILIADAPCHGTVYHSSSDDYPNGDPNGLHPEVLLQECTIKGINLFFAKINDYTDRMISVWNNHLKQNAKGHMIKSFQITDAHSFLSNIADAIACVSTRNYVV